MHDSPSSASTIEDAPALASPPGNEHGDHDARPVSPWPIAVLALGSAFLVVTYIGVLAYHRRVELIDPVLQLVDLAWERNIPTWWSSLLLAGVGATALLAAWLTPTGVSPGRRSLGFIAVIAFAMSLDEAAVLHERLARPARALLDRLGIDLPTYEWVVLGAPLGLGALVGLLWWTSRVPKDVGVPILLGAAIFGVGALGFESVSGWARGQGWTPSDFWWTVAEETCEMAGCVVVIFGLLRLFRIVRIDGSTSVGHRAAFSGGSSDISRLAKASSRSE